MPVYLGGGRDSAEKRETRTHTRIALAPHAYMHHASMHTTSLSLSLREHEYEHDGAAVLGACVCWRVGLPYIATCVVCLNTFCMNERNELIINTEMRMMCVFCIYFFYKFRESSSSASVLFLGAACWSYLLVVSYPESYV